MKRLKLALVVVSALALLALAGFLLFRHFVTNRIMDGGNGMENPEARVPGGNRAADGTGYTNLHKGAFYIYGTI